MVAVSRPARKFIDPLYVDPKEIPAGQDYQWASYEILGDKRGVTKPERRHILIVASA